jgi:hypothetical protein
MAMPESRLSETPAQTIIPRRRFILGIPFLEFRLGYCWEKAAPIYGG